jgi:hypothetical protein
MGILSFLTRKKDVAHPTGSGEFMENISWWFWDNPQTPGLLTFDAFSELLDQALSTDERSWMRLEALSRIKRNTPPSRATIARAKSLFGKMGACLIQTRENRPAQFREIIRDKWTRAE